MLNELELALQEMLETCREAFLDPSYNSIKAYEEAFENATVAGETASSVLDNTLHTLNEDE